MKRISIIVLSAPMLSACADGKGYDSTAVPGATVTMQVSSERSHARRAANELKTYYELEACELAAERAFAVAVNLKRMASFDQYATRMQALAADRDADRVNARQVQRQADAIRRAFLADCNCKPRTRPRWNSVYAGDSSNYPSGYDMGQGNHAMGPGPLNF